MGVGRRIRRNRVHHRCQLERKMLALMIGCIVLFSSLCFSGCGSNNTVEIPIGLEKIEHFIFIMQENRSFDSYFGTYPGADGLSEGVEFIDPVDGTVVTPYHDTNGVNRGGPHGWDNAQADINGGKMDGFLEQSYNVTPGKNNKSKATNPKDVMGWHDWHEIPNYWDYARLYVLQDHM